MTNIKFSADLFNFREVGSSNEKLFRTGKFFFSRSETPSLLVKHFNLSYYIDFRGKGESLDCSGITGLKKVGVTHVNFQIQGYEGSLKQILFPSIEDYSDYYMRILEYGIEAFRHFFLFLSQHNKDTIAYGCYLGKDRTGIATYLILKLLGYDKEFIFKDFLQTNVEIVRNIDLFKENWMKRGITKERYLERIIVKNETLELFDMKVNAKYGGALGYIHNELGLDKCLLKNVKKIFKIK